MFGENSFFYVVPPCNEVGGILIIGELGEGGDTRMGQAFMVIISEVLPQRNKKPDTAGINFAQ